MSKNRTHDLNEFLKRATDLAFSIAALMCLSPIIAVIALAIFLSDFHSPIFAGERVGMDGQLFKMLKFRSMQMGSDKNGPSSTSVNDPRITQIGDLIRRTKLDEIPQLWNVVRGEMSMVGPRPQVRWAVDLYTPEEMQLVSVRPGLTDYASLVFRDEGQILARSTDPDGDYLRLIAPMKNRLGLHYVKTSNVFTDLRIMVATCIAVMGLNPIRLLPQSVRDIYIE